MFASVTAQVVSEWGEGRVPSTCCMAHTLCPVEWLWNVLVVSEEASPLFPASPRVESRWTVGAEENQGIYSSTMA